METEPLLETKNMRVRYGGIYALNAVSIAIKQGEIVALMGPNGAGKSTALRAVCGMAPIQSGSVAWRGKEYRPIPHRMAHRGVALVPQGRRIFAGLTVGENLEIGGVSVGDKKKVSRRIEEVMAMFPDLAKKRDKPSGVLSGGQQQMLAIARGLILEPDLMLLDEPSLGLAPKIVRQVFEKIKEISEKNKTALMVVEHNIRSLLAIADRAYLMDKGKVVAEDTAKNIQNSDVIQKVFLGEPIA